MLLAIASANHDHSEKLGVWLLEVLMRVFEKHWSKDVQTGHEELTILINSEGTEGLVICVSVQQDKLMSNPWIFTCMSHKHRKIDAGAVTVG